MITRPPKHQVLARRQDSGAGQPSIINCGVPGTLVMAGLTPQRYRAGDWCPLGSRVTALVRNFDDKGHRSGSGKCLSATNGPLPKNLYNTPAGSIRGRSPDGLNRLMACGHITNSFSCCGLKNTTPWIRPWDHVPCTPAPLFEAQTPGHEPIFRRRFARLRGPLRLARIHNTKERYDLWKSNITPKKNVAYPKVIWSC